MDCSPEGVFKNGSSVCSGYARLYKDIAIYLNLRVECVGCYSKGGDYRRWFGNADYVVNWENGGFEMINDNYDNGRLKAHNFNGDYALKSGITWSSITSGDFSCRYLPEGFMFDAAGPLCYVKSYVNIYYITAFLLSKIARIYLNVMNPTINMHPGYILALPFKLDESNKKSIDTLAIDCITISKNDWDSFETSWDFKKHPLI